VILKNFKIHSSRKGNHILKNFLKLTFIVLAVSALALVSGCSEEKEVGIPPVINSIAPDSAGMGDTMLVEGERFNVKVSTSYGKSYRIETISILYLCKNL